LKDASATAIYGSKGANGVILITTKTGRKGKPSLQYNYTFGMQELSNKLDLMNAGDYARTINAARATQNQYGTPTPIFTDAEIAEFDKRSGTDWQNEIFRTVPMHNHLISLSGGSESVSYFFSGSYLDQKGILLNTDYNRLNLRANLNAKINDRISAGLNLSNTKSIGSIVPHGENVTFLSNAILVAPRWGAHLNVYDDEGNYTVHPTEGYGPQDTWNPAASLKEVDVQNHYTQTALNIFAEITILKGLSLRSSLGGYYSNYNPNTFYNSKTLQGRSTEGLVGSGYLSNNYNETFQNTNILTFNKSINNHSFSLVGVAEQQIEKSRFNRTDASRFTFDTTGLNDLGGAKRVTVRSGGSKKVLNSYLGRLSYNYSDIYILTATFRADGASVFGRNNKWGYFPSAAFAYRISEEKFMESIRSLSNLKLRASWGITGNQAISPYQTLASIATGGVLFNYPYNGTEKTDLGLGISSAANPNLKWESTTQTNFGVDIGFFDGRISSTIDVYNKHTENLLLFRELPGYTGLWGITDNIGSTENKGLEISLSGDPLVGTFKWNTGINISWNKNEVLDIGENEMIKFASSLGGYGVNDLTYLKAGEPFGSWFGYKILGIWSESEKNEAARYGQLPGMPKYYDVNDDGKIDFDDRVIIGNALPDFIFGWTNRFSYKAFDLSILMQGSYGNDVFNQARIRLEAPLDGTSIRLLDRWTPENQNTDIPAFIDDKTYLDEGLVNTISLGTSANATSRYVEDASYLRMKNITLGYKLPKHILNQTGIKELRAYISGTNLLTFTKYTGYDPEVSSFNNNDAQLGMDLGNYPTSRTFTIGVEINF
jgi:TonB-dependent starch-binding outer membrane protein SusC